MDGMRARVPRAMVLIVDEDALVRRSLGREFSPSFGFVQAASMTEALDVLAEPTALAAVVSDFRLGVGGTGGDLLAAVRRMFPALVRVMVTAEVFAAAAATAAGTAHAIMGKPWEPGTILRMIHHLMCAGDSGDLPAP